MKNVELSNLLKKLSRQNAAYKKSLLEAENEIEKRFGFNPSDVDNDQWIDCYHVGTGYMSLPSVEASMKEAIRHKGYYPLP